MFPFDTPPHFISRHFVLLEVLFRYLLVLVALGLTSVHPSFAVGPYDPPTPTSQSSFDVTPCNETFAAFDAGHVAQRFNKAPLTAFQSTAALCPSTCLGSFQPAAIKPVYGSFPYHASSSVCLAAIHAGIINASTGGGVFVSRFYRHDWSNTTNQTIFPYDSDQGSLSNGVQSEIVPAKWYTVPSSDTEWSYVVRSRGEFMAQRREAPFPPRAGHLHLLFALPEPSYDNYLIHVIVGGYNGTAYLNDVWVGVQYSNFSADLTWSRLPDAPFTPRSDMFATQEAVVWSTAVSPPPFQLVPALIMGGQTNHSCGLTELGVCSDEAWTLRVQARASGVVTAEWSVAPVFRVPFTPRCGAALLRRWFGGSGSRDRGHIDVVAGQLTYNDSTCSAAPITVHETWSVEYNATTGHTIGEWTYSGYAPFSPRRTQGSCDSQAYTCLISGGIRHLSIGRASKGGSDITVLTASELFADVWRCAKSPRNDSCTFGPFPISSLPVPAVNGLVPRLGNLWGGFTSQSFGGQMSAASFSQWLSTPPPIDDSVLIDLHELAINITLITSASRQSTLDNDTFSAMWNGRQHLPLHVTLTEAELNDPTGFYQVGAPWSTTVSDYHLLTHADFVYQTSYRATLYPQSQPFASHPNQSTWFVPLATSSLNSTRPSFTFLLSRHSHRDAVFYRETFFQTDPNDGWLWPPVPTTYISGGQSGITYCNDFITVFESLCLPPVDPSFRDVLGPILMVPWNQPGYEDDDFFTLHAVTGEVEVRCDTGYHFDPPALDTDVTLSCMANGMWMVPDAFTIQRCVRKQLPCEWPLDDLGELYCMPVLPLIQDLSVTSGNWQAPTYDVVTVYDVPVYTAVRLSIVGNAFFEPVSVFVGGVRCSDSHLQSTPESPIKQIHYNVSLNGQPQPTSGTWGRLIVCSASLTPGVGTVVTVISGRLNEVTEVDQELKVHKHSATLTTRNPVISLIYANSSDCQWNEDQPLALLGCSVTHPFNVRVCVTANSVGREAFSAASLLVLLDSPPTETRLNCSSASSSETDTCADCTVYPLLTSATAKLVLRVVSTGQQSNLQSATVGFGFCPAGSRTDRSSPMGNATSLCVDCPPGTSTNGVSSAVACPPCTAGQFQNDTGATECKDCPIGTFADGTGATNCSLCPLNSFASFERQTKCEICELDQYIVYKDPRDAGISGKCVGCPERAQCFANGTISAGSGAYLLIDQQLGTVSAAVCSPLACVDASLCLASSFPPIPQRIRKSQLLVQNCCAQGRWQSYDLDSQLYGQADTQNVLCAACLPGYSPVNGRCIPCSAINYGALFGVLMLFLVLVYVLHRLPHDYTGSAKLLISTYFLQQSMLFLSSGFLLTQLLSLVNLNLLGDHTNRGGIDVSSDDNEAWEESVTVCVVPLSDAGRISMALFSPLIAFGLLAVILLLQLAARASLRHSPSTRGRIVYGWLFVPSEPKMQLAETAVAQSQRELTIAGSLFTRRSIDGVGVGAGVPRAEEKKREDEMRSEPLLSNRDPLSSSPAVGSGSDMSTLRLSYQRTCVRLLLLGYTGLSVVTLSFFHSQPVGGFGWRLVEYPTIDVDSPEYRALLPFIAIVLAVVVCGLPLVLALFLWIEHRRGSVESLKRKQQQQTSLKPSLLYTKRETLLLQLCAMYLPQHWWMASFVLVRRLVLAALLVSIHSAQVWIWLTLVNYCLLALHVHVQPYERPVDNMFESLTLLALCVQTTLLSVWPPPYINQSAVLGAFHALVVAPLVPLVVLFAGECWQRYRAKQQSTGAATITERSDELQLVEEEDRELAAM